MAIWKPYRINDAINEIEAEKFVLPVIQRRLVWEEEKMELLFDTLLKGDSFGGIMVIEEEKDTKPLFNFRPFTKDGEPIASRQVDKLSQLQNFVIDGQQRLQSFYIGLRGSINGKILYFDLFSDYKTEFQFRFANDINLLPNNSKENIGRPISSHQWYAVNGLLQKLRLTRDEDPVAEEICDSYKITDKLQAEHVLKNTKAFLKNVLNAETLGVSMVHVQKHLGDSVNRQRIVELFKRLNDGGTKLSPFDLVASILKGFAWEMEGFLDTTLKEYAEIGIDQDNLIKLIFILQDDHKKEMASIEEADASFAIKNRHRITATLKALRDFLVYSNLIEYYKQGVSPSFVPLYFIAYHLFHKSISDEELANFFHNYDSGNQDFPIIKNWMYRSFLCGVFKSKGAGWIPYKTGIRKLLEVLSSSKNQLFPAKKLYRVYMNHPLPAFALQYAMDNLDSLDYGFVFYLMYDKKEIIRVQDADHIMPRSVLAALQYDIARINCIANLQLIDYETNRGAKNAKPFSAWINDPECVKDKGAFIKKHLIPTNESTWEESNFLEFVKARGEKILEKINENIIAVLPTL